MTRGVRQRLYPVLLAGGAGTRLWPLSRADHPKQLLPLAGRRPMVAETALRVSGHEQLPLLVVCNDRHWSAIVEALTTAGVPPRSVLVEPEGRGTGPAIAAAALAVQAEDPDGLLLILPSDHAITDPDAFREAVDRGAEAAARGHLVTFGIVPHRAETGYGYIRAGAPVDGLDGTFRVAAFHEKPDAATAARYLAAGDSYWNSGIFVLPARPLLDELDRQCPGLVPAVRDALDTGRINGAAHHLDHTAFAQAPALSIDVALLEKTTRAAVVPTNPGWSDLGGWTALWEATTRDAEGNAVTGEVWTQDVRDSYLRAEDGTLLVVAGLSDVTVVATGDAVLVARRDDDTDLRPLVEALHRQGHPTTVEPARTDHPWGHDRTLDRSDGVRVKRIEIDPGAGVSLPGARAEHWVVTAGTARLTRGDAVVLLQEGDSTTIDPGAAHRLDNPGPDPLRLVAIQWDDEAGDR